MNFEKIVKVVDAFCDCIPGVSIVTNGAQLLYKLAHKVDATANPVNPTWKDDIKIHVLNKTKLNCLIAMIPLIGNLYCLISYIVGGLKDQLRYSVVNSDIEVIKLYLARHPLNDDERGKRILSQSAFSSNPEAFMVVLNSRNWSVDSVIEALGSCWCIDESDEKKVNLILDYYDKLNMTGILDSHAHTLVTSLESFIKANRPKTANRILELLPQCDFSGFDEILAKYSFRDKEGALTADQIKAIVHRCKPLKLIQLTEYCRKVHAQAESLKSSIDSEYWINKKFHPDREVRNKQKIMSDFYEIHLGIIQELLNRVIVETESPLIIIDALSGFINNGETQLLEVFLTKYEDRLTSEEKLSVIRKIFLLPRERELTLKGLEYFFTKYNQEFTDEQCIQLLQGLSVFHLETSVMEKIIEMRPSLQASFGDALKEIENKCEKIRTEFSYLERSVLQV